MKPSFSSVYRKKNHISFNFDCKYLPPTFEIVLLRVLVYRRLFEVNYNLFLSLGLLWFCRGYNLVYVVFLMTFRDAAPYVICVIIVCTPRSEVNIVSPIQ